eukprot:TRINITY_DN7813_c0_g1_i1.p1 TRINITY_DN7813_c0_g1~~TRINITY_DN7813_c0_g1_i1.p1  ORF type:complete len:612 (+),score=117.88 TRINITY_DN7813_c0_g1_i1:31-1836(+)
MEIDAFSVRSKPNSPPNSKHATKHETKHETKRETFTSFVEGMYSDDEDRASELIDEVSPNVKAFREYAETSPTYHEGYLYKKGNFRRNWKKRWFRMENGEMSYYSARIPATDRTPKPLGTFQVKEALCGPASSEGRKYKHSFQVHSPDRTYFMFANSAKELRCWAEMIIKNGGTWDDSVRASSYIGQDGAILVLQELSLSEDRTKKRSTKYSQVFTGDESCYAQLQMMYEAASDQPAFLKHLLKFAADKGALTDKYEENFEAPPNPLRYYKYGVEDEVINLSGRPLDNKAASTFADFLLQCKGVRELRLEGCDLTCQGLKRIILALEAQHSQSLRKFLLSGNNIEDEGLTHLARFISHNTLLDTLWLDSNPIGVDGTRILAKGLLLNSSISIFSISSCNIGDAGAEILSKILAISNTLQGVCMDECSITDEGLRHLASALEHNTSLTELHLEHNKFTPKGAQIIGVAMEHNKTLTELAGVHSDSIELLLQLNENPTMIDNIRPTLSRLKKETGSFLQLRSSKSMRLSGKSAPLKAEEIPTKPQVTATPQEITLVEVSVEDAPVALSEVKPVLLARTKTRRLGLSSSGSLPETLRSLSETET